MIILKINNITVDIIGSLPSDVYKKLERKMSFRPEGYQFVPQFSMRSKQGFRIWDGWKKLCYKNKKRCYFYTGLFSIAINFFKKNNIKYKIIDTRIKPKKNINLEISSSYIPRLYQEENAALACSQQRGIIQAATGSGKTVCSALIIKQLGVKPFIFFVTSIDLLEQAKNSLSDYLLCNGKNLSIGQIGGGVVDIKDINVMTIQTAVRALGMAWNSKLKFDSDDKDDKTIINNKKKEEIRNLIYSAKGSISDEIQHWRAEVCQLVTRNLKNAYYSFGASATPFRDQGDDLIIQSCFGKKICTITASELIKEGYLIKPEIKIIHLKEKLSKFRSWQEIYKEQVVENEKYNYMISNIAIEYIKHNRLILILVQQIKHGKFLESLIPGSLFLSGNSPKKLRIDSLNKLRKKEISCMISTIIFDEGIDCRPLNTLILAGQGRSKVRAMQRIGRVLRPYEEYDNNSKLIYKKEYSTVIDFCLHQKYLEKHSKARERMYKTEQEFSIEHIEI